MEAQDNGETVIVVDAGGGTIDLSTYTFLSTTPITVEEATAPDCTYGRCIFLLQISLITMGNKFSFQVYLKGPAASISERMATCSVWRY